MTNSTNKRTGEYAYPTVSAILGCILIAAGIAKFLYVDVPSQSTANHQVFPKLYGAAELLFGLWLCTGLHPRWTRCLALGCFLGLFHIALYRALSGYTSCNCFGKLHLQPWLVAAVDLGAIVLLAFVNPLIDSTVSGQRIIKHIRVSVFAIVGFVIVLVTVVKMANRSPQIDSTAHPDVRSADANMVQVVVDGIRSNSSTIQSLQFRVHRTVENALVKKEEVIVEEKSGGKAISRVSPRFDFQYRFTLNGATIRRDTVRSSKYITEETVVRKDGKALQYQPGIKQAWMRPSSETERIPLDPRCLGFLPPIEDVAGWIEGAHVLTAQAVENDTAVILLKLEDSQGRLVFLRCARAYNFLPESIQYSNPAGGVIMFTELTYQQLSNAPAWFLRQGVVRSYDEHAAQKIPGLNWVVRSTTTVEGKIDVNRILPPDVFDPHLPSGTVFTNGYLGRNTRLDSEQPAFAVPTPTSRKPRPLLAGQQLVLAMVLFDCIFILLYFMFKRWIRI